MKTFLQILFFYLLLTQNCFTQWDQCRTNNKSCITDRMDKHLMGISIPSGKNNEFLNPNFNDELKRQIDPFEVNNTPYLFQNDRIITDGIQKNLSPIHKKLSPLSQFYVIDSAKVLSTSDTVRYIYTFNINAKMTSCLKQKLNGDIWINRSYRTYTYDEGNNMLSALYDNWENGQWVISYRETYTYDAQGNILSQTMEWWEYSQRAYRYTFTYDAHGNKLSLLGESWNGQWVNSSRGTFTNDAQGNMLTYLLEDWQNGQWVNYERDTYTYDAQGNMLSGLRQNWQNGWMNYERNTYTYEAQGNMLNLLHEYWQNGQWVNSFRYTYTYDAQGNRLNELIEESQNGQLVISYRLTYTYDAQGNRLTELGENWQNGQWVNGRYRTYTYDGQGNLISLWNYIWQNSTWTPSDLPRAQWFDFVDSAGNYYDLYTGYNFTLWYKIIITEVESESGNVPGIFTLSQNYPNPFNPTTRIKYSIPKSSQVTLKIFNTLGEEIETLVNEEKPAGTYELTWNANNLSSGVYFYRIQAGDFIQTIKMILMK